MMRRIDPPELGWPPFLTPPPAAPARDGPSAIQAYNCNKFYHSEQAVILSVSDPAAGRITDRYCCPAAAPAERNPRMRRKALALVSGAVTLVGIGTAAGAGSAASAASGAAAGPALSISLTTGRHAISRDIYGMNFAPAGLERQLKLPVVRWGGNATTRYNYLLDTANHASDWYFENIPNTVKNPAALPNGSTADQFIDQNQHDPLSNLPGWARRTLSGYSRRGTACRSAS
jgi:hypothetical protein